MAHKQTILWVSDDDAPPNVRQAMGAAYNLSPYDPRRPLPPQLSAAKLAMIYPNGDSNNPRTLIAILAALEHTPAVAILMLPDDAKKGWQAVSGRAGQFMCVAHSATPEEIACKLAAARALQPAIQNLQGELEAARKISTPGGAEPGINEEMRLAARLQRDFLPRRMPEVGSARFGVLYRPTSWVSGDIYDVVRLDETHVGFYVADAVGHGMPAALLTMFIKHGLQTKRIVDQTYQIVPPHVSLSELNADICQQNLSSCQFCTAVYAVLDTESLELTYARAGHPPPVLIRASHKLEYLDAGGGLLGVFEGEQFESRTVQLARGDRIVMFTDGVEEALRSAEGDEMADFGRLILPCADATREELLLGLVAWVERAGPNRNGEDDITVLVADVEKASA